MRSFIRRTLYFALVLAIVISGSLAPGRSVALSEIQLDEFARNSILFYDPGTCIPSPKIPSESPYRPGEGGWYWDGSCSSLSSRYIEMLNRDFDAIKAAADGAGVPWEVIPAQAIVESKWGDSEVYRQCNNPLGITGGNCAGGYARYGSIQEAYYEYTQTAVVQEAVSTGLFSSAPYSFVEYMQYGGIYVYAGCERPDIYPQCIGFPDGFPTPGYVQSVSSFICAIQKWAEENGKPISAETYANFVDPKIDTKLGGSIDGLDFVGPTASKTEYCPPDSSNHDWGEGGMRIANAALELAWPYQADDTCIKNLDATVLNPQKKAELSPGRSNIGQRINWSSDPKQCRYAVKPEYAEAKTRTGYTGTDTDCGGFVVTALFESGLGEGTIVQKHMYYYRDLEASPLWENVTDIWDNNIANLMPGDVFHTVDPVGHTFIYVGDIPAKKYGEDFASASQNGWTGRMTGIGSGVNTSSYLVYRYIGDGGGVEVIKEGSEEEANV